jgi:flagellar hook-basal body complex protein FliE
MDVKLLGSVAPELVSDRITLGKPPVAPGESFEGALTKAIETTTKTQASAEASAQAFAKGTGEHMHENMIALEKANVTLRMMVSVRNRVVDAYRDLMHMS